jgi:outer membrane protein OmpA-like peptidoglycan-associated protein
MSRTRSSHLNRIAALASGALLLLGGSAMAQTVPVFDDAPSIDQLRSIMVPESHAGIGRSIVMQRPDVDVSSTVMQRASTQDQPAPRTAHARVKAPAPPVVQAAANVPAPRADAKVEPHAVAFHVNFAFNSAAMPNSAHEMIETIAQLMKESPEIKVRIEGHTDAVGSVDYNVSLSERRALSVGEYLVKLGVDPSRLVVVGKGMAEPLTSNKYDPANRRVQFVRIA